MNILDYCKMPPREVQKRILLEVEEHYDDYDIFIIVAPVASGKSLIADTIATWTGKGASIIVPDNILVKQYLDTFNMHTIRPKATYKGGGYNIAKYRAYGLPTVLNYTSYLANRTYNPVLIADEAHHLVEQLKNTTKLWKHLYNVPDSLHTAGDLIYWLATAGRAQKLPPSRIDRLDKLYNLLQGAPERYIIEHGVGYYRGNPRELLKVVDLIPRDNPPIYWPPGKVKKMFMMSATFGEEDIYDLGLDKYKVKVIDVESPIPATQRPIFARNLCRMTHNNTDSSAQSTATWAVATADLRPGEKGLLHTTYAFSKILRKYLKDDRFIFHTRWDKEEKLNEWLTSPPSCGKILVGCGVTTGLSLEYDKCRWQAIVNIPFANIKDRAVKANLLRRKENFYWQAVRHILQASGRNCRNPDDYGDTIILDSRFSRLYKKYNYMFPTWFKEAYEGEYKENKL